jgi:hypothetical protein
MFLSQDADVLRLLLMNAVFVVITCALFRGPAHSTIILLCDLCHISITYEST